MNRPMKNTLLITCMVSASLILFVVFQHNLAFQKSGTIVLPAGGTYLGVTPTVQPAASQPIIVPSSDGKVTVKGRIYPYTFEAPDTLKLVTFPNDPYDIYALSINNQPPEQNVLIGVDDLNRTEELKKHLKGNKRAYVEAWWKQFSGLTGVSQISAFTNTAGLTGYKAKYKNTAGQTPNDDVFIVSPDGQYVIHLANGPLPKATFDAIVDSVTWNSQ